MVLAIDINGRGPVDATGACGSAFLAIGWSAPQSERVGRAVKCGGREILIVEIGGRRYGLPVADVHGLVRAVAILPLPRPSSVIEGVINLRGSVVPVVDARAWLGLPTKAVEPGDHFVIVGVEASQVVLHVDRALELATLAESEIERVGGRLFGDEGVVGVAHRPEGLVPLLDLRSFESPAPQATSPAVFEPGNQKGEPIS